MLKIHFLNGGEGDDGDKDGGTLSNSHLVSLSVYVIDICLLLAD